MIHCIGVSNTTGVAVETQTLKHVDFESNSVPDISLLHQGSLMDLNWKLFLKFNLSNGLKRIWSKVLHLYHSLMNRILTAWHYFNSKLKKAKDYLQDLFAKRSDIDNRMKFLFAHPAFTYWRRGGLLPQMTHSVTKTIVITDETHILQNMNVDVMLPALNGDVYSLRQYKLSEMINFNDSSSVEQGLKSLQAQYENKLYELLHLNEFNL